MRMTTKQQSRGFTLIEVMVTVAIIAILGAVALPSYSAYVQRSKLPAAFDGLSSFATRMEQRYQDSACYGNAAACASSTACGASAPAQTAHFSFSCALDGSSGTAFTATATGRDAMAGYAFTINNAGTRTTTAHPRGPNASCWTSKGGAQCES